jgi:methylated-DNA-protein-cysteine methyltransferase-like protein
MRARARGNVADGRGAPPSRRPSEVYARIYAIVCEIPRGRVATYGQIARLLALPGRARQVGYALSALSDPGVPWHRVVNAQGGISPRSEPGYDDVQRRLLEREGVRFDAAGRVTLARYGWEPGKEAAPRRPQPR